MCGTGYNEALLALQFQMNYLEQDSMILTGEFDVAEVIKQSRYTDAGAIAKQSFTTHRKPVITNSNCIWQTNR